MIILFHASYSIGYSWTACGSGSLGIESLGYVLDMDILNYPEILSKSTNYR